MSEEPERRRPINPPKHAVPPQRHVDAPPPGTLLGSHYRQCFGCGPDHPTGLHLTVTAGEGCTTHAKLHVTEHHQGAPGLAHGGLLAAALDESLGAVTWLLRVPVVTVHLETNYRQPVPVGSTLLLEAECFAAAGRKIYSRATGCLADADGKPGEVAVEARSVFVSVPLEHFRQHARATDVANFVASHDETEVRHAFEINP